MPDPSPNPYAAPATNSESLTEKTRDMQKSPPLLTYPRVFRGGTACLLAALVGIAFSRTFLVRSPNITSISDVMVVLVDVLAIGLMVIGTTAIITCHWFPDPDRKFSWHQKKTITNSR